MKGTLQMGTSQTSDIFKSAPAGLVSCVCITKLEYEYDMKFKDKKKIILPERAYTSILKKGNLRKLENLIYISSVVLGPILASHTLFP